MRVHEFHRPGGMHARRKPASNAAVHVWTRLNRAQRFVFEGIERDLKKAGLPSLVFYDALLELWRAPNWRLRQVDLEQAMLFPQYSVSRLVDRLERKGLARRARDETDGRVSWVEITDKGLMLREAMWRVYAEALARRVGGKLSNDESNAAARTLEKLYKA